MKRLCCLLLAAICLTATPLFAVDYTWNASGGYVNNSLNWLPNTGYPGGTASDNATIDNGGIATIDATHLFGGPIQQLTAGNTGSGAVLQNGGDIVLNNGLEIARGTGSYGYYQLSSGTATATGGDAGVCNLMVGDYGTGVYSQTGGTMTAAPVYTVVGWHGGSSVTSQMSITGGSFLTNNGTILIGWGSSGIFNIGGTADVNTGSGSVQMTNIDTGHLGPTAILNLGSVGTGGGILRTTSVHRFDRWDTSFGENYQSTVNFHGGTLQATGVNTGWWCTGFLCTKNAYIYGEGATIDTNGFDETVITPLDAPTGQGITGITLSGTGSGYIGEPVVSISGDGTGATARAILNGSGGIDHIEITNPGTGYYSTPTITITGGGGTAPVIDAVSLADNVSGGLTKTGLGNLKLTASCTYTGPTVVEAGKLTLSGINLASSGITVKSGATVAGYTKAGSYTAYPATTVEAGGTLVAVANGVDEYNFNVDSLHLANNSTLHFTIDTNGFGSKIYAWNNVSKVGTDPITVNVTYSGTPLFDVTVLDTNGAPIDTALTFALPGGLPVYDSADAIHGEASVYTDYAGGTVQIKAGGLLTDVVPTWNDVAGGDWNDTLKWGSTPPNPYPQNGGDRAMFVQSFFGTTIPINLNVNPTVSSLIFASPNNESYDIKPAHTGSSAETITLDSSIAQNWHITVLGGTHSVEAGLKLGAGTGQSIIRLVDGSHLTLSGPISNATTATGLNFVGNFNAGTGTGAGTGVLTLSGNNTYSGPTTVTSGVLEVAKFANAGEASSLGATTDVSPANLVLNNATLRYIGTTASSTNRGATLQGNVSIQLAANATINGQISGDVSSILTISGAGTLTCGYAGTAGNTVGRLSVTNGSLSVTEGAQLTASSRGDFGNLGTAHVTVSSTSTTAPAKLSIADTSWMGVNYPPGTPSSAVIELSGTGEMHIGTAHPYANAHLGFGAGSSGTITMTGDSKFTVETANPYSNMNWGWFNMGDEGATADITLSNRASFAVTQSQMAIAATAGGKGHVTLNNSATFSVAGIVHMNGWGGTVGDEAVINLNGGSFAAPQFIAEAGAGSVINFNGGVLKAAADTANFIGLRDASASIALNVQAGGAKIDTNGKNVVIKRSLVTGVTSGADGGLTKLGAGTLGMSAVSSYTGPTVIEGGTLQLLTESTFQEATTAVNAAANRADGPYSLGRVFSTNSAIQVTQLGIFANEGKEFIASHVVHIAQQQLDGTYSDLNTITFAPSTGTYQNGFRFLSLSTPLSLGAGGTYKVWVDSFGGEGNDFFAENLSTYNTASGAISIGNYVWNVAAAGEPTNIGDPTQDTAVSFIFKMPRAANLLPIGTPVVMGGVAGSAPTLDLRATNQQIASLADLPGAEVNGVVTSSLTTEAATLTLDATSGTTTFGGSIEGNLSLVKTGASNQVLSGSLTYTGNTDIQAGELAVAGTATLTTVTGSSSGVLHVCDGATLTATSIELGTLVIGGAPPASATAVPEPSMLALMALVALGGLCLVHRVRK